MATEKIIVQIGLDIVELIGAEKTVYLAQRKLDNAEADAFRAKIEAKAAARQSALEKLAALGLSAEEIAAL